MWVYSTLKLVLSVRYGQCAVTGAQFPAIHQVYRPSVSLLCWRISQSSVPCVIRYQCITACAVFLFLLPAVISSKLQPEVVAELKCCIDRFLSHVVCCASEDMLWRNCHILSHDVCDALTQYCQFPHLAWYNNETNNNACDKEIIKEKIWPKQMKQNKTNPTKNKCARCRTRCNAKHYYLSLIHIWRCRRIERCRSRWSPYH